VWSQLAGTHWRQVMYIELNCSCLLCVYGLGMILWWRFCGPCLALLWVEESKCWCRFLVFFQPLFRRSAAPSAVTLRAHHSCVVFRNSYAKRKLYLIFFFPHLWFKACFREGVLVALCASLSLYFLSAVNVFHTSCGCDKANRLLHSCFLIILCNSLLVFKNCATYIVT
jgi:hypothetical protein